MDTPREPEKGRQQLRHNMLIHPKQSVTGLKLAHLFDLALSEPDLG